MAKPAGPRRVPKRAWIVAVIGAMAAVALVSGVVEHFHAHWGWRYVKVWAIFTLPFYWWAAYNVMYRRYGDDRMEATFRHQAEREPVWRRWFFAYFMPLLAAGFVAIGAANVGPEWRAARREGPVGWFTIYATDCSDRGSCRYYGEFVSDDRAITREGVEFLGDVPRDTAERMQLRARDTGRGDAVYTESGGVDLDYTFVIVLGGGYLLGLAIWLIRRRRPPRPPRPHRSRHLPVWPERRTRNIP